MPIHDWTRVGANRWHHFHQEWTMALARALNSGLLPEGYAALAEQRTEGPEPDGIALATAGTPRASGTAIAELPRGVSYRVQTDAARYSEKANRLTIRHPDGEVVAIIELVSPGNKESRHALRSFLRKVNEFIERGVHVLIVDLFPPPKRDPRTLHQMVWEEWDETPQPGPPAGQPLLVVSYCCGATLRGYITPLAIGETLVDAPVHLTATEGVECPLQATYEESWKAFPKALKAELERKE
ncbi:MAG: DUF4058 family protein [Gemmataceae bacterium]